ncbi:MAG: MBL fold metallo-hydrolase [Brevinematales bacterium]|nr:MBL fold metallo-hydrolase [Brevinematales bacterium]
MEILRFVLGDLMVNTYIVRGENESFVIDPASDDEEFISKIPENLKYIFNTHGHYDHIAGNSIIKTKTDAKIIIHKEDAEMLVNPVLNFSSFMGIAFTSPKADILIEGEEGKLIFDNEEWKFLHMPGHTNGLVILFNENKKVMFSGDLIFEDSIGRVDLPNGNGDKMKCSLKKLERFSDDFLVYPGHGEPFYLKDFKNWINYFLKEL